MIHFQDVRSFFYNTRKAFFPRRKGKATFLPGLPAGLATETLQGVIRDHFGDNPASFSHQHLSGWKVSGAYRLFVKTQRGQDIRLVYKDAAYDLEQIPALANFPIRPGQPEYSIYSQPRGPLAPYLPQVYLAEETIPKERYRYILEDLSLNHHAIATQEDYYRVSTLLSQFHQALGEWAVTVKPHGFLQYGKTFSSNLVDYAQNSLVLYNQQVTDSLSKSVLLQWPEISGQYLQMSFLTLPFDAAIHGDPNYTNFHLHNQDPHRFCLVDWEWAGFGLPHADLVSLYKSLTEEREKLAFRNYYDHADHADTPSALASSYEKNWRIYLWCKLERALIDASFLAMQYLQIKHAARVNLPHAISHALEQALKAYRQLS